MSNTKERLDALLKNPPLRIKLNGPAVVFSDEHEGDGSSIDHFWPNHELSEKVKLDYISRGFTLIDNGDWKDFWKFDMTFKYPDYFNYRIGGNHDRELKLPEAAIIEWQGQEIFIAHGYQGEWINDEGWHIAKEIVGHVWKNLEELGLQESSVDRHSEHRLELIEWANNQSIPCIFGHTHKQEIIDKYYNAGCSVSKGIVECIEIDSNIILKTYQ